MPQAHAAFIGTYYNLGNFTLTIVDNSVQTVNCQVSSCPSVLPNALLTDLVNTPDFGLTLNFTGDQSGSGFPGTTDLVILALASGLVQFHYSYSTSDSFGGDTAGYLLDGVFTQFADTSGQSGDVSFSVLSGQSFGFRITTVDNGGGPGVLAVTSFDAPTPEPRTASILLALGTLAIAGRWWTHHRKRRNPAV